MAAAADSACQSCGRAALRDFYEVAGVPVHSCLLVEDRRAALALPRRDIVLALCRHCGLIQNRLFDPAVMDYSPGYEDSQAHSPRFLSFAGEVIDHLADTYDLRGGRAVEIGCGKGDFLVLLANRAGMRGVGYDPAHTPGPLVPDDPGAVRFVPEPYSLAQSGVEADLVCCRHTLEHVPDVRAFLSTLRATLGDRRDTVVFFEVPESGRILAETAFWDVYYEHCSYFVEHSLRWLFAACGFDVLETWLGFDDQYLLLVARPSDPSPEPPGGGEPLERLEAAVEGFATRAPEAQAALGGRVREAVEAGRRVVLWGASSKAVGYMTTLGLAAGVHGIVDINPAKHGRFIAGTGHEVLSPDALARRGCDVVVVMNPVYRDEIGRDLRERGIDAEVWGL